jgi:hypothetical protein
MTTVTELAAVLTERPDEVLDLGLLLGLLADLDCGDPAGIHQALRTIPDPVPGATRGEYAVLVRLNELGVRM